MYNMITNSRLKVFLFLFFVRESLGYVKFATYYQDHMVLQRGPQRAIIWGTSDQIGSTVTVTISGDKGGGGAKVEADQTGEFEGGVWKVKLPATTDPGPFTITASVGSSKVAINDVLFGDVWLCSGQSNMYFIINWLFDPAKVIAEATKFTNIRVFKAHRLTSDKELHNLPIPDIPWSKPSQKSLHEFAALCWLYAQYMYPHRKYPLGMVEASWGGTSIEAWSSIGALCHCPTTKRAKPHADNVLWNSMIKPLLPMTIYGALWYQGEANTRYPDRYACEFPAMISNWRQEFNKASLGETKTDFPFGFVQLAPNSNMTHVGGTPLLRWAQTAQMGEVPNAKMPNTFMAVSLDLPDFHAPHGSIHPRYKEDVAERLVLAGRAVAYKEHVIFQGPFPERYDVDTPNKQVIVHFKNGPIEIKNSHGFEICCSFNKTTHTIHDHWEFTPIVSHTASSVTMSTAGCEHIHRHFIGVRYEWHQSPCPLRQCAVYCKDHDLPAPPFFKIFVKSGIGHIIG